MGWLKRSARLTGETARRITGISLPFAGISWAEPGPSQRDRVRDFLTALEDRRVLYNPMWLEVRSQVDQSIIAIRKVCTDALRQFEETDFAVVPIRAIRAACRRFNDDSNLDFQHFSHGYRDPEGLAGFFTALGAFRASVGHQVAMLVAHYDVEVEGDLASVLPQLEEDR